LKKHPEPTKDGAATVMTLLIRSPQRSSLVALVMVGLCACVHTTRVGPAVPLTIGDPENACEQEGWLELAPAEVRQWGASAVYGGLGLFRPGQRHPEDLERVVGRLQEPTLEAKMARIRRTDAAGRRSLYWSAGVGLGGLTVGLGTGAALNDRNHAAATVFGIGGLAIGLVGVIGALVAMPREQDQLDADAGHYVFFDAQDLPAVTRGTERADQGVRQACTAGGRRD
jgi:hypothetical protein